MRAGKIKAGDRIMLKKYRADAYGSPVGPHTVLSVYTKGSYKREYVALEGLDDGLGGQGVVQNSDIECIEKGA